MQFSMRNRDIYPPDKLCFYNFCCHESILNLSFISKYWNLLLDICILWHLNIIKNGILIFLYICVMLALTQKLLFNSEIMLILIFKAAKTNTPQCSWAAVNHEVKVVPFRAGFSLYHRWWGDEAGSIILWQKIRHKGCENLKRRNSQQNIWNILSCRSNFNTVNTQYTHSV